MIVLEPRRVAAAGGRRGASRRAGLGARRRGGFPVRFEKVRRSAHAAAGGDRGRGWCACCRPTLPRRRRHLIFDELHERSLERGWRWRWRAARSGRRARPAAGGDVGRRSMRAGGGRTSTPSVEASRARPPRDADGYLERRLAAAAGARRLGRSQASPPPRRRAGVPARAPARSSARRRCSRESRSETGRRREAGVPVLPLHGQPARRGAGTRRWPRSRVGASCSPPLAETSLTVRASVPRRTPAWPRAALRRRLRA